MQETISHIYIVCRGSRESNPGSNEEDVRSPINSATCASSILQGANIWICGWYLHVTQVNFTTVQMHEIEPTRSNLVVFPKIRNMESLRLRSKNTSWCRLGKWHCLKTRGSMTPTCFFQHPRRIFFFFNTLERTSRVTAESAGALRDGANVVRTETGNYFCVRICYKFLMSDCKWDWDLGLRTFWVLAKREVLSKSEFRKKTCFACSKNRICHRSTDS